SSSAPLPGSIVAAGLPRIGRTSIARDSHSCVSPQYASCSENFAIQLDVSGQTLRANDATAADHSSDCHLGRPTICRRFPDVMVVRHVLEHPESLMHDLMAFASATAQPLDVEYPHRSTRTFNDPLQFKIGDGLGDAWSPHTQR